MGVIVLDDGSGQVELVAYSELFESARSWLKEDQLVIAEAKVSNRMGDDEYGNGLRITADVLYDLDSARSRYARRVEVHCNGSSSAMRLKELLAPYRLGAGSVGTKKGFAGNSSDVSAEACPVRIIYRSQNAACELELGDAWRILLHESALQSLVAHFKMENVRIVY
jgi:DNA polymerase-3 subunit alpha